jgi:tetratricopeptide (TPR) repeat protein
MADAPLPAHHSPNADFIKDKQVAFTGRLASMTRAKAAELVRAHGGSFVATVSQRTSFLVVGQDGWPLQQDGRLTDKLRKARSLQRAGSPITVLPEGELLSRLGLEPRAEEVRQHYSTAQLSRLLKIPGDRLRRWVAAGLIQAAETINGISLFDYSQVVSARTLCDLFHAGVRPDRLRRSIRQLQSWMDNVEQPLLQLAVLERNGDLVVRLEDGLAEPTGQRCFDFADCEEHHTVSLSQPPLTADEWFELGCQHENGDRLGEAVEAYRQALLASGPNFHISFNLANVLYRQGDKEQAVERYHQALELDQSAAEVWNNLGVALADLARAEQAVAAFERALAANPQYADAHYNLADHLESTGRSREAIEHWQAYVNQDPHSEWAAHARRRLRKV